MAVPLFVLASNNVVCGTKLNRDIIGYTDEMLGSIPDDMILGIVSKLVFYNDFRASFKIVEFMNKLL